MEAIRDAGPKLKSFFYHVCQPNDPALVRGSVVVLHGAEGYGGRYGPFGDELVKQGYAMFAIDHIGHGMTIMDDKDALGKWDDEDFHYSAYNAYYLVDKIKRLYPGKPVYLLGDDYGGTMAQYMMGEFENIFDGVIISSCGMPTAKDKKIFFQCWLKKKLLYDGGKSKGTFKSRTRFLNMHYKPNRTKYDWLNSDPNEVDRFIADPLSGYVGTIGYYYYQYKYIVSTPGISKLKNAKKDIPILMLGGKNDYITHCGIQMLKLRDYYLNKGFTNVNVILYDRSRHDVLLEWNKDEVARDIADFINKNSFKEEKFETAEVKNVVDVAETVTLGSLDSRTREDNNSFSGVQTVEEIPDAVFVEEEPEDELRLSTDIKK
jgi:alpha-beta hydrolase superfamily lysophospholipase